MGGCGYSADWCKSIKQRDDLELRYNVTSNNRYAIYKTEDNSELKEQKSMEILIEQYVNMKMEIKNCRVDNKTYKAFIELVGQLLEKLKEFDEKQANVMEQKYKQILEEYYSRVTNIDKLNQEYIEIIEGKVSEIMLENSDNSYVSKEKEAEFLMKMEIFTKWLEETLKLYGLYPETKTEESLEADLKKESYRKISKIDRIKSIFFNIFRKKQVIDVDYKELKTNNQENNIMQKYISKKQVENILNIPQNIVEKGEKNINER